jgi:glyoxylase-like metal-dependent hydrolase (beta-lactamase superfamily II)
MNTSAGPLAIPLSVTTVYLLPCRNGYLQVDTGYSHDYDLYRRQLAKRRIDPWEVKYLFLTHHHDDHAGFLNDLTRAVPLQIIAHREAAALLKCGKNDLSRGGGYVSRRVKYLAGLKSRLDRRWTLSFPHFILREEDILLTGDDDRILRELGIAGRALYTPGHCIDHQAIVLDTGEAFCGDAASSFLLWAGTRYCTLFMSDMDEAYRSWKKLIQGGARTIHPAHGRPFPAS